MVPAGFEILYEEGPCLVVNKPPGLLTQAPKGIDSLEARVKRYLIVRENKPGGCYLGVPHRLDRPASGAIVFAKHVRAARRISEQFEKRTVRKVYWAVVEGRVEGAQSSDSGTWEDYMRKVPGQARAEIVSPIRPDAREAILHFRVVQRSETWSWLDIELETGRMHQIRLQCSARGHPILGDAQYGATGLFGEAFEDVRLRAIALHARSLEFNHPMTKTPLSVTAPLGESFRALGILVDS